MCKWCIKWIVQLKTYNNTTTKAKGTWVFPIVQMILTFFSEDLEKASGDKIKNNNMQMKHLMDSFEAQRETKMAKK